MNKLQKSMNSIKASNELKAGTLRYLEERREAEKDGERTGNKAGNRMGHRMYAPRFAPACFC